MDDAWTHLGRSLLPLDNLPMVHFALSDHTDRPIIYPCPKDYIFIHQV